MMNATENLMSHFYLMGGSIPRNRANQGVNIPVRHEGKLGSDKTRIAVSHANYDRMTRVFAFSICSRTTGDSMKSKEWLMHENPCFSSKVRQGLVPYGLALFSPNRRANL